MFQKYLRWMSWLVGTLTVGALGNGLWELARPLLIWLFGVTIDVANLGMTSLTDSMYVEIARGTNERSAEKAMIYSWGGYLFLITFAVLGALSKRTAQLRSKLNPCEIDEKAEQKSHLVARAVLALFVAMLLILIVQNTRTIYISRAANNMEQLMRVVAPYQTERARLIIISRFSAMTSKQEYILISNELKDLARKNGMRIPEFDIY